MVWWLLKTLLLALWVCKLTGAQRCSRRPPEGNDCSTVDTDCLIPAQGGGFTEVPFPIENTRSCYRTCIRPLEPVEQCEVNRIAFENQRLPVTVTAGGSRMYLIFSPNFNDGTVYRQSTICRYHASCAPGQLLHFFITEHALQPAVPCFGRTDCVDSLTLSRVVYGTSTTSCGMQDPFDDFEVPDVNNGFRASLQVEFKTNRKIEDCGVNIEVTCVTPNFFFSPGCTSPDMFDQGEPATTERTTDTMATTQTVPPTRPTTVTPPTIPTTDTPPTIPTTVTPPANPTTDTPPTNPTTATPPTIPTTDTPPTNPTTVNPRTNPTTVTPPSNPTTVTPPTNPTTPPTTVTRPTKPAMTSQTAVTPPTNPTTLLPPTKPTETTRNEPTTVTLPTKSVPTAQTVSKPTSPKIPTTESRPTHYQTASPTYKQNYRRSMPYFTNNGFRVREKRSYQFPHITVPRDAIVTYTDFSVRVTRGRVWLYKFRNIRVFQVFNRAEGYMTFYRSGPEGRQFPGFGFLQIGRGIAQYIQEGVRPEFRMSPEERRVTLELQRRLSVEFQEEAFDVTDDEDSSDPLPSPPRCSPPVFTPDEERTLMENGIRYGNACNGVLRATACAYQQIILRRDCITGQKIYVAMKRPG